TLNNVSNDENFESETLDQDLISSSSEDEEEKEETKNEKSIPNGNTQHSSKTAELCVN
ncbi:unnamed protein product, partial [Rotaria socialis]